MGSQDKEIEAEILEVDFEKGTATFLVPDAEWFAGKYLIRRKLLQEQPS